MTPDHQEQQRRLREDFLAWSGGFPPESAEQIQTYLEYASSLGADDHETLSFLRLWLRAESGACQNCDKTWDRTKAKPNQHGCRADDGSSNTLCPHCGWCSACDEVKP